MIKKTLLIFGFIAVAIVVFLQWSSNRFLQLEEPNFSIGLVTIAIGTIFGFLAYNIALQFQLSSFLLHFMLFSLSVVNLLKVLVFERYNESFPDLDVMPTDLTFTLALFSIFVVGVAFNILLANFASKNSVKASFEEAVRSQS